MSRDRQIVYNNSPLAGRPPFATDEPESIYQTGPPVHARYLQAPPPYLDNLGDEKNPFNNPDYTIKYGSDSKKDVSVPLAAPRPGYAAPVAALNLSRPSPTATPEGRRFNDMSPIQTPSVPSTPHPLQPPMTPIAPAFIRPSTSPSPRGVNFSLEKPIIRGDKEETLLPKRGERGDDFWRRFSMVVKEEDKVQHKSSNWLKKTQTRTNQMSRFVWFIGIGLLIILAGAFALAWYISHASSGHTVPTAVGGKNNESAGSTSTSSILAVNLGGSSTQLHVSPTYTVNYKRGPLPSACGLLDVQVLRAHSGHRRRLHLNRDDVH